MSIAIASRPRGFVLEDVDWRTYSRLLRIFEDRPSIRLAYDRGRLEIMSPLPEHEFDSVMLGWFVVVLAQELGFEVKSARSTTFRRRRKMRGLEADNSYWIANELRVRGKRKIDLKVDPAPDLAIEVDYQSSSLDRLSIYASLKVPEVWRLDNGLLVFLILGVNGKYEEGASLSFPGVKPADLIRFILLYDQTSELALVEQFRQWVRQRIAEGWK